MVLSELQSHLDRSGALDLEGGQWSEKRLTVQLSAEQGSTPFYRGGNPTMVWMGEGVPTSAGQLLVLDSEIPAWDGLLSTAPPKP